MPFFPDFALRDALLWLLCLILLATLAVFLPYGPGVPGIDWELGQKADPLAPAPPGIKPEWYFLWAYQLLKEVPAHLGPLEGPQAALLVVAVLLVAWALVPWLDRRAARDQPSPAFVDLGVAAVLFLTFLTLKAWDIGAGGGQLTDPAVLSRVARICAAWTLGLGVAINTLRAVVWRQRWQFFSGGALLHVTLHGLVGLDYLAAGAIAVAVIAAGLVMAMRRGAPRSPGSRGDA